MSANERGPACPSSRASQSEQPCRTDPVRQAQAQWRRNASRLLSSRLWPPLTQKYTWPPSPSSTARLFIILPACPSPLHQPRERTPSLQSAPISRPAPSPCAPTRPPSARARAIMIVMQRPLPERPENHPLHLCNLSPAPPQRYRAPPIAAFPALFLAGPFVYQPSFSPWPEKRAARPVSPPRR